MADRPNLVGRFWYDCVYWSTFTFFTFGFSLRRDGWGNVPTNGPLLVLANHQSMFDPVLVGLASRRYLSYLARKNLFEQPVLAPLIRSLNAIPIDRGLGRDGIQAVLNALGQGQAVLIFPEGERTHNGEVQPLKPGGFASHQASQLSNRAGWDCRGLCSLGSVHEDTPPLATASPSGVEYDCRLGWKADRP